MRNSPIAVIDSGIGGLSLLKPLVERFSNENFVYLADNECMPYGNKSAKFLKSRLKQIIEYLECEFNIKLVILACNTASSVALDFLNKHCKTKVVGLNLDKYRHSIVLCTKLTSRFYPNLTCIPCPRLAKDIEENYFDKRKLIKKIQNISKKNDISATAITLGCTHYELILNEFKQALPVGNFILPAKDFALNLMLEHPNLQGGGNVMMLATIPTKSYIDRLWRIFKT